MDNADSKHNYGCITLKFEKALTLDVAHVNTEDEAKLWITLGYFDLLRVYPISIDKDERNWLKCIYGELSQLPQHTNTGFYTHPLHLMTSLSNKAAAETRSFFEENLFPFFCVSFLQCTPERQKKPSQLDGELDVLLSKIVKESLHQKTCHLTYIFYRTLNLSDRVVLWRTDSLPTLLSALKQLHAAPMVGDLHSVPAIRYTSIKNFHTEEEDSIAYCDEVIDQIITRYIVQNSRYAAKYFQIEDVKLRETPYFNTGVEDISSVINTIRTKDFLEMLYCRIFETPTSEIFQKAFLDCETHLGAMNYDADYESKENTRLQDFCIRLNRCFSQTREKISRFADDELDQDWLRTSENLFHSLLDMSRNALSDGFCYLVIDSAAMFCSELCKIDKKCTSRQLRLIQRYLRGWGSLIDQTMRLDGKFTQQPGYVPALCPIPSRLLELFLAFTTQCGKMMQANSGENNRFALLIVPKLCRQIKVDSIFLRDPPSDRLLFVDIPFDILFDPFFALAHLCHEVAHFCGEDWRLRDERKKAYLKICAQEFANQLDIQSQEVIEAMYNYFSSCTYHPAAYLDTVRKELTQHLVKVFDDAKTMEDWISSAFPAEDYNADSYARTIESTASWKALQYSQRVNNGHAMNHLHSVIYTEYYELFRECYADVANIFTLNLSAVDYIRLAEKAIVLSNRDTVAQDDYTLILERWAIVLHVTYPETSMVACQRAEVPDILHQFAADILQCYEYFFNNGENPDKRYLDRNCIRHLCTYLSHCLHVMRDVEAAPDSNQCKRLHIIRAAYDDIVRHAVIDDNSWYIISKYREETLAVISDLENTVRNNL